MDNELNQYLAIDYYATGEGRTIFLLITRAYPHHEDYEVKASFDENGYNPGVLKNTQEDRAIREMKAFAGDWYSQGVEVLTRDQFFARFGKLIPADIINNLTQGKGQPGNILYKAELHYNFS